MPHNRQVRRTGTRRRGDGASALFDYALAPRLTRQHAASQLRRWAALMGASVGTALLLAGCASAPKSNYVNVAVKATRAPVPACEKGHEAALQNGTVTVRPGQTVCVELRLDGSRVVPVRVVAEIQGDNTLVLRAWQEPVGQETFLSLHNPLDTNLRYKAHMSRSAGSALEYTSSCPVLSRRLGIEHWPYPVVEFQLSQFQAELETETMECM